MVLLSLFICIIILLASWKIWNDFLTPMFILSLEWTLMYLIILFSLGYQWTNNLYYITFAFGLLSFFMGFLISVPKRKIKYKNIEQKKYKITFNVKAFYLLFILQLIIVLAILFGIIESLHDIHLDNLWRSIRNAYQYSGIIGRFQLFVVIFPLVTFTVFMLNPQTRNKWYFILTFLVSIPVIFTMSRGGMIMILLALIFIFLNVKNYTNAKIAKWGLIGLIGIILIFSITSIWKFSNIIALRNNPILILKFAFENYFISPMVNFVEWAQNPGEYLYGQNTFRFILAILNSIGFDVKVVGTVQKFNVIKMGDYFLVSNVYTVLHYYARDFGIWYSFIIEFFLGIFHGFLYKKSNFGSKVNLFYMIMFALMMYPLFNQFFADIYLSTFSTWLQYYFWVWLITRKKYVIVTDK